MEPTGEWAYLEILDRFLRDGEKGAVQSLETYLSLYPGNEDTVRRVWEEVMESEPAADRLVADRYRIVNELGRGGQATVYLADDTKLGRQVALKVLPAAFDTGDARRLLRLRREAGAASRLNHPGICTVHDSGRAEDVSYIAMQYVEGSTLAQILARRRHEGATVPDPAGEGPVRCMTKVVAKAASALAVAHEARIVHRDIKPGNVMVTETGDPVLLDFGLARDDEATAPTLTVTGDSLGTPAYMAPEQWSGDDVTARADVWALGVVLYEGLTLVRPFEAPSADLLADRVRSSPHRDPRKLNPAIPNDLRVVIDVALEKDPARRYPHAGALADDLWRHLRHEPVLARPIGFVTRWVRWIQRNRAAAAVIAGAVITVATALVAAIYVSVERTTAAEELREERNQKQRALDEWELLADLKRIRDLGPERETLWPATPARVAEMDDWIGRAHALRDTFPSYLTALEALQAQVLPYDEADRARDGAANRQLDPVLADWERFFVEFLDSYEEDYRHRIRHEDLVEILDERLSKRRTWRFTTASAEFRHDALKRIVALRDDLDRWIAEMEARRAFAHGVDTESIDLHRDAWERCIAKIAASPLYGGLRIPPQRGLVPIGKDAASGLYEFAHLQTGDVAQRDADGFIEMTRKTGLVFVLIPGGTFWMGAVKPAEGESEDENRTRFAERNERPVRRVELGPFFLSKYEMTCGQWHRHTGTLPNLVKPGSGHMTWTHPIARMSWLDARKVLGQLGLVLPTEARWEYACRAGTRTPFHWGWKWGEIVGYENTATHGDEHAVGFTWKENIRDGVGYTAEVGHFKSNPWGLYDMGGNVSEWCADPWLRSYDMSLVADRFVVNDRGERYPGEGKNSVVRGGWFARNPAGARSSFRRSLYANNGSDGIGLRPAREVDR